MLIVNEAAYTNTFSVKNEYFVFVYIEAVRRLHQYVFIKNGAS